MTEGNNKIFDELIRQKFDTFEPEPPSSAWGDIAGKLGHDPKPPASGGPVLLPFLTGIILIVVMILSVISFTPTDTEFLSFENDIPTINNDVTESPSPVAKEDFTEYAQVIDPTDKYAFNDYEMNGYVPEQEGAINTEQLHDTEGPSLFDDFSFAGLLNKRSGFTAYIQNNHNKPIKTTWRYTDKDAITLVRKDQRGFVTYPVNMEGLSSASFASALAYDDYRKVFKPGWSFGFAFTPEVTYYNNEQGNHNRSYSLGFDAYYTFNSYFLQSGIGTKFANDEGQVHIDYNEHLGSYEHVYDVTFDSTAQGVIPTYHTYTEDVYDTVNRYTITDTRIKYTYLEIPVMFGYKKQLNRFFVTVSGGPNVSILLNRNGGETNYPAGKTRIVNVDQNIPDRISLNWQLVARAGIGYDLNSNVSLLVEPVFKYYMNSEYDLNNDNAYGIGVKAGIIYRLKK